MDKIPSGKGTKSQCVIYVDRQNSENIRKETTFETRLKESSESSPKKKGKLTLEFEDPLPQVGPSSCGMKEQLIEDACQFCIDTSGAPVKPPKTYYATRTHTQIAQVVKQLKNSPYKDSISMAILSSRKQSCLFSNQAIEVANSTHGTEDTEESEPKNEAMKMKEALKQATKVDNLDDACAVLRTNYFFNERLDKNITEGKYKGNKAPPNKKPVCPYYTYGAEFKAIYDRIQVKTHDIEDLMDFGKRNSCCAYFGSKYLHKLAEVVFVPYNYLLYPTIRSATEIDLKGSIVVFDEAHNIEDVCRDASSWELDFIELSNHLKIIDQYNKSVENGLLLAPGIADSMKGMSPCLTALKCWIQSESKKLTENKFLPSTEGQLDSHAELGFNADDILKIFTNAGLGPKAIIDNPIFDMTAFLDQDSDGTSNSDEDNNDSNKKSDSPLPKTVKKFVQSLIENLKFIYQNLQDFVMVLKIKSMGPHPNFELSVKCLNSALSFKTLAAETLSIVVASGTLSPQTSFEGELQTKFVIKLSASHVVKSEQVLKIVLSTGVGNELFELNRKTQRDLKVQDDIGRSILELCRIVPNGVLVFLPSYKLLQILKTRWTMPLAAEEPLLTQIAKVKALFFEESRDKDKFKSDMQDFKNFATQKSKKDGVTGAILFAVYRGKVSEGIDFSDDQARAVIAVGIPYPPVGAFDVLSKKAYNNKKVPELLSGHEWYNVQAYRAMNQSFGRCIRHKDDWGAIILMDSRFSFKSVTSSQVLVSSHLAKNLSSWVQDGLKPTTNFQQAKASLRQFIYRQQQQGKTSEVP